MFASLVLLIASYQISHSSSNCAILTLLNSSLNVSRIIVDVGHAIEIEIEILVTAKHALKQHVCLWIAISLYIKGTGLNDFILAVGSKSCYLLT